VSPWSLPPGRIAVIVRTLLRHDWCATGLAGGNEIAQSTVRRWPDEGPDIAPRERKL
jgi:hypothetical protein